MLRGLNSSGFTSGTRRATKPVTSHEKGKKRIVITTNGTIPWLKISDSRYQENQANIHHDSSFL